MYLFFNSHMGGEGHGTRRSYLTSFEIGTLRVIALSANTDLRSVLSRSMTIAGGEVSTENTSTTFLSDLLARPILQMAR